MVEQDFPSEVPVCSSVDEKNRTYEDAEASQRPWIVVADEDDKPGWRAMYMMDTAGAGMKGWYDLSEDAVEQVKKYRKRFEERMERGHLKEGCNEDRGALRGLSKDDAIMLADRFADVVWDTENWEKKTPQDLFR